MRKQQQVWYEEHANVEGALPAMANTQPAGGFMQFVAYLKEHQIPLSGRAVDIGAGQGRNSVCLAKLGFEVWALEYIEPALAAAKKLAKRENVVNSIHFEVADAATAWHGEDDFFDVAVDYFSGINIETRRGREIYRNEMYRTLKPGSYALVTACSIDDEWEKALIAAHPGSEPNSSVWPQTGKFQKSYDESELRDFYQKFDIADLKTVRKRVVKLGREGTTTYFWMVLRKPL